MTTRYTHLRPRPEVHASVVVAPLDVKLMHMAASLMYVGLVVGAFATCVWSVIRLPAFALTGIQVHGDVTHNSPENLRSKVVSQLSGNFFTADLNQVRTAFESVPWVRAVTVQREFPNRLHVTLQEHQPVAYWGADDDRMVNSYGEVFEANAGDLEDDRLPRLYGPQRESHQVLAMYLALTPLFKALSLELESLALTERGSWRAVLVDGAVIELGRGQVADVTTRMQRMVGTLAHVTHKLGRKVSALESADLRYDNGYALRLRGVSTHDVDTPN